MQQPTTRLRKRRERGREKANKEVEEEKKKQEKEKDKQDEPQANGRSQPAGFVSGPLFGVIPSFVLIGPLAVLAALFPNVFAGLASGLQRWRAFLVVTSINGTLAAIYFFTRHLLPDAAGPGAAKRWNLYLRWMVRGPDAVDLGAWPGLPRAALLMPLDTHIHRVARRLGLTGRSDAGWRTAEEITAALRLVDAADPVRYDFALCHLGMCGACPARLTPAHCAACPLVSACRFARAAAGSRRRRAPGTGRSRRR